MIGVARIVGWLVPLSLAQGAIVAVAVWLALRALPLGRARLRHAVAVSGLAVLAVALVATAAALLVDWHAHVACWTGAASPVTAECRAHGVPGPVAGPAEKASAALGWASLVRMPDVPGERAAALSWMGVAGIFGAAWLAALFLLALREARIRRKVRTVRADAVPVEDLDLAALLAGLLEDLGIRGPVEIRESRDVATPCVIGTGSATILFPKGLRLALDPAEVRGVLAHELAHVRWRDARAITFERAARGVLFFNPFAGWLGRRAREEREVACDRVAADTGAGSRTAYARALLLMEGFRAGPLAPSGVPALLGEGQLAARVERLLSGPAEGVGPGLARARRAAIAVLAAGLLTAALAQATLAGAALGSWAVMAADETYDHRGQRSD